MTSLQAKSALAVSSFFVLAAGVIAVWALSLFEAEKKASLSNDAFTIVSSAAGDLDSKLRLVHSTLIAVAATVPRRALEDYEDSEAFLGSQIALHALFDNGLFLVLPDGRLVGESPPRPHRRGSDVSAREYFHKTLQTRKPYISKPYRSTHNPGAPALIMTAPVFDAAGNLSALLYGSMDLRGSNILADIAKLRIGRTGYVVLADGRDSIISHPDGTRVMKPAPAPGQNLAFDRALEGWEGTSETVGSTGIPSLFSVKRLESTGWLMAAVLPLEEFYAPIRDARRYFLWSTAIGTLTILVLVWLLTRRTLQPLSDMTAQVRQMVELPDVQARLSVDSRNEIGVLAGAFNALLDRVAFLNAELERRVQTRTAELEAAKNEAERANLAKSDFLSRMSHELRTPLNAILGFAQVLRIKGEGTPAVQREQHVAQIERAGWHLLELINEVLDLARIESGKMTVQREPVDLRNLCADCVELAQPLASARDVSIVDRTQQSEPLFAWGDRTRLSQVLMNLLSNAVKYNRRFGSVTLSLHAPDAESVELTVADTGPGLTAEQQRELFQPFNRLGAQGGAVEGTGIGLVITKALLDLMGGTIALSSKEGEGASFTVRLPRSQTDEEFVPAEHEAQAGGETSVARRIHLLYIEDNPSNVELVRSALSLMPGAELTVAPDGPTGLATAVTARPDLILVDITLPGIDGYEVCRRLRARADSATTPVIALSANAMQADVDRGREAGFDAYLTKPIDIHALLAQINLTMSRQAPPNG